MFYASEVLIGEVPIKLLTPTAKMPQYMTEGAAAMDLVIDSITRCHNTNDLEDLMGGCAVHIHRGYAAYYVIGLGIAMAIPPGWCGLLEPRSSMAKAGVQVHHGLIDSDYRGEIRCVVSSGPHAHQRVIQRGDRICQLRFAPAPQAKLRRTDDLPPTARGAGGFGSTGA